MNIVYLAGYFYPEHAASSYLSANRNQAFADEGFKMTVFAPTPCRGITKDVRDEYKKRKKESLFDGAMSVNRFSMYAEGKNPVLRALRYGLICFAHLHCALFRTKGIDVMFLSSTPPVKGAIGAIIKKFKGYKFVYNLQDIFPDSLVGSGLAKKGGLLWKIGRVIENFTYRNADKIIVISEDFKRNIMAKGVPEDKIEVIYNWVDEQAVVDVPRELNVLFDRYGLDRSKFYITYSGNIGLTQNMDMLLDVADELRVSHPDIRFVLIGEGAYKAEVERMVKERGLDNVTMLPFQPYEDISHVFSLGDAGLVISKPGVGANSVPSKTWSIMSASRPVLANFDENELKDIIASANCGIFTPAGDKEAFKESIVRLYDDRNLAKQQGANGRAFVMANLTKAVGTAKYVAVLKEVVGNS